MLKKTTLTIVHVACCLLFFCGAFSPSAVEAATDSPQIAVLPFKVNAATDMSYIRNGLRDMLASRLAARVGARIISSALVDHAGASLDGSEQPELIRSVGRTLSADYIISGSISSFAGSISIDAVLYDLHTSDGSQSFNASAGKEGELIQAVDTLTWDIAARVFDKQRPSSNRPAPVASAPTQDSTPYQSSHPDRLMMGRYGSGAGTGQLIRPAGVITSPLGFAKTQNLELGIVAMAVGDVDGDGASDFILASSREVRIYRMLDGNRLQQIGKATTPFYRYKIHAVTVADLNHNGIMEIYVSAADPKDPSSFVLEWNGSVFNSIAKDLHWYIRVMDVPGEGKVLAGQKSSLNTLLSRGIFRLTLSGPDVLKGEMFSVQGVNLFNFTLADLDGDGSNEVVAISQGDKLMVLRPSGKSLWVSEEFYGGTTTFIGGESSDDLMENLEHGYDAPRIYIPSRIIVRDVNNDGRLDVIINRNSSNISRIMDRYRSYSSGEIQALTWNGIGLTELWRTRKIDGYIADYELGPVQTLADSALNEDGKNHGKSFAELYVALVLNSSGLNILADATSAVLTFPIEMTEEPK